MCLNLSFKSWHTSPSHPLRNHPIWLSWSFSIGLLLNLVFPQCCEALQHGQTIICETSQISVSSHHQSEGKSELDYKLHMNFACICRNKAFQLRSTPQQIILSGAPVYGKTLLASFGPKKFMQRLYASKYANTPVFKSRTILAISIKRYISTRRNCRLLCQTTGLSTHQVPYFTSLAMACSVLENEESIEQANLTINFISNMHMTISIISKISALRTISNQDIYWGRPNYVFVYLWRDPFQVVCMTLPIVWLLSH